ncbi:hypothetical protein LC612_42650, partial [Nostoc sp. CHAB 5834]|nr:hypothetical protein [Nostoc sp. CHAB 5834]
QRCNCDSIFVETQKIVENNYAGWFDKVKVENRKAYSEWTATKFSEAKTIQTDSTCAKKLQEWISYFKDKHLRINYSRPKSADTNPKTESKDVKILTTSITENKANTYFKETKSLDPIEGLYIHPSYRLAITKVKPDLFHATVLTTKNENWKAGDVKLIITKTDNVYSGMFYDGNKSDHSNHTLKLVDNILDFDIAFFEKIAPNVKVKRDIIEYEISKDRYAPSIKIENDVAIWKFPCFYSNSAEQTTFLLNKYKDKLTNSPYWIIDLRDNDGGDYQVGMQLMKYIYSKPVIKYNSEMRMTNQNIDTWFNTFVKEAYDQLDAETKKVWDTEIEMMRSKVGSMYNRSEKATDTLQIENTVVNPKKIALLTNENTVSSGELFTMLARQSEKVIVMGTNTAGMMDYGNIVHYKTNCTTINVQLPIDRMLWLDTGFSVDKEGIKPDVYLEGNSWTEQAIKIIKK